MADQLTRVEQWPTLLAEAIEAARTTPFSWGTHDCATWAFTVAAKLRGTEEPEWLGRYTTRAGAARALKSAGVTLEQMGTEILGDPLASPLLAQRGDVVFAGGAYGICVGRDIAQIAESGLVFVPLGAAQLAWRV